MNRLKNLTWRIGDAPWLAVFNTATGKMISSKDNTELLRDLLYIHLAPPSKQSITRARKQFKDIQGVAYPVAEEALLKQLTPHTEGKIVIPESVPIAAEQGSNAGVFRRLIICDTLRNRAEASSTP